MFEVIFNFFFPIFYFSFVFLSSTSFLVFCVLIVDYFKEQNRTFCNTFFTLCILTYPTLFFYPTTLCSDCSANRIGIGLYPFHSPTFFSIFLSLLISLFLIIVCNFLMMREIQRNWKKCMKNVKERIHIHPTNKRFWCVLHELCDKPIISLVDKNNKFVKKNVSRY